MLCQWRGAKGTTTGHRAVDGASSNSLVLNDELDARSDGSAIGFDADQLDVDPILVVAGILEDPEGVGIGRRSAAHGSQNIFVTVILQVGKGSTVSFVQVHYHC